MHTQRELACTKYEDDLHIICMFEHQTCSLITLRNSCWLCRASYIITILTATPFTYILKRKVYQEFFDPIRAITLFGILCSLASVMISFCYHYQQLQRLGEICVCLERLMKVNMTDTEYMKSLKYLDIQLVCFI